MGILSQCRAFLARWKDYYGHKWLRYWYGEWVDYSTNPPTEGDQFLRCHTCQTLLTRNAITRGGCFRCTGRKVTPAILTRWEKCKILFFPPLVAQGGGKDD